MNHNSTWAHCFTRGPAVRTLVMLLLFAAAMALSAKGSIFDDDWAPPPAPRDQTHPATLPPPPAPATPNRPEVAPPPVSVPPPAPRESNPPTPAPSPVETGRRAVPGKAELDRSRALLKEAFAAQMADRTAPARHEVAAICHAAMRHVPERWRPAIRPKERNQICVNCYLA
jgi:hypothetical protein